MSQNAMTITVKFQNNEFFASASINCPNNTERELSFVLNNDLTITSIFGENIRYQKVGVISPPFRSLSQVIKVTGNEPIQNITIAYCGSVQFDMEKRKNWYNIVTDDFVSLSFYSAWYPQEMSIDISIDKVIIEDGQRWFVVKGIYNNKNSTWEYGNQGFDPYNIVAYNRAIMKKISSEYMNIYFLDDSIALQAEKANEIYNDIINFYNGDLFQKVNISTLDIACACPFITVGGGYRRKDFMWCTSLGNNEAEISWLFAHETAHIWCTGADTRSWEDWLNETTAEWASLLFALKNNDTNLFHYILQPKIERSTTLPPIKTPDGARPDGVHDKGTVLFYKIYKDIGFDSMKKVIRCFTDLENKNTYEYLNALRKNGFSHVADVIKENLEK